MKCCNGKSEAYNLDSSNNKKSFQEIDGIIQKYKGVSGSLISLLQEVQEVYSYLSKEVIEYIAEEMKIKPAKIYGVATFYTQFKLSPIGEYEIMLCQGTACHVNGSKAIEEAINEELGICDGETSSDNLFTLNNVACLGCCSLSPVMMINGETYGKLTPDKAKEIVRNIKAKHNDREV